ncbi:hypothetical protein [Polymorphospora rubra]|uniref:hypothetical protein n=1 Tax=Polymorphospora rubra TaxID=338584 RepID=UPI001BB2F77A|nr:hypothetical protein [Polymorphospora rubra]
MTVRTRAAVGGFVALAAVAGLGVYLGRTDFGIDIPLPRPARSCTVAAPADQLPAGAAGNLTLNPEQMANAATISAVGVTMGMSEEAVVVALATAFQESKLENLAGGDRDSIGLFQQRPSQGWGTPEQIRDPRYAATKFYAGLKKVRGWEDMRVTEAAQAVQRSAFPELYEQWKDESQLLASALVGKASGAVACTVGREPAVRGNAAAAGLVDGLLLDWGQVQTASPAELLGLTVAAADSQVGWRYAHWLVSHAGDHGVKRVRFGDREWTADEGEWSRIDGTAGAGEVVAEVFGDS